MKSVLVIFSLLFSSLVFAGKPVCYSSGGGYCEYSGNVSSIYVNKHNLVILHFDVPFDDASEASVAGYSITQLHAGAIPIDADPDFAKLFYSTALSAQATQRAVKIQMRGVINGYLEIDRIWLEA